MRRRVGIVVGVVALVLAGCGRGSTNIEVRTVPRARITNAAAASTASETARLEFSLSVTAGDESLEFGGGGPSTLAGPVEEQRGSLDMEIPGVGGFEMLQIGLDAWIRYDGDIRDGLELPPGIEWIHLDVSDTVSSELLEQQSQFDVNQYLDYLEEISTEVEEIGSGTIHGAPATEYRAHVNMGDQMEDVLGSSGLGNLSGAERKTLDAMLDAFQDVGLIVWIDDLGRLVRMELDIDLSDVDIPDAPDNFGMTMQMDMLDFGVPVDVVAPPPEQVVEFDEVEAFEGAV